MDEWKRCLIAVLRNKPTDELLDAVATVASYACDCRLLPDHGNPANKDEAKAIDFIETTVELRSDAILDGLTGPERRIEK